MVRQNVPVLYSASKYLFFSGKNFNKDGNSEDWWTTKSKNGFKQNAKCLVDQYSKYKMYGKNVRISTTSA